MSESKTPDDILYAFSIEPTHDRATLERYLREYPELTEDLVDLSYELRMSAASRDVDSALQADPKSQEAWQALLNCAPAGSSDALKNNPLATLTGRALVELAGKLDIPRSLLTALRDRLAEPSSIPMPFISRLAAASGSTIKAIQQHLTLPPVTSYSLQFKSDNRPTTQGQVPFKKLVDDTVMTDEQRQSLLRDWTEDGRD